MRAVVTIRSGMKPEELPSDKYHDAAAKAVIEEMAVRIAESQTLADTK